MQRSETEYAQLLAEAHEAMGALREAMDGGSAPEVARQRERLAKVRRRLAAWRGGERSES